MTLKIMSKGTPFTCQPFGFSKPTVFITFLASVVYKNENVAPTRHRFCSYINNNESKQKETYTAMAFNTLVLASVGDNIVCDRMDNAYTPFGNQRVFGIPVWDIVNLSKIDEDFDQEEYEDL